MPIFIRLTLRVKHWSKTLLDRTFNSRGLACVYQRAPEDPLVLNQFQFHGPNYHVTFSPQVFICHQQIDFIHNSKNSR